MSEADVENYKQIKVDLDELRLLVEKSELWVYKAKTSSEGGSSKKKTADKVSTEGKYRGQVQGSDVRVKGSSIGC